MGIALHDAEKTETYFMYHFEFSTRVLILFFDIVLHSFSTFTEYLKKIFTHYNKEC